MKKICVLALIIIGVIIPANANQDYSTLHDMIGNLVQEITRQMPENEWSESLCRTCACYEILPRCALRKIADECSVIICRNAKLAPLIESLQACYKKLDLLSQEVPDLTENGIEWYRSCCKRLKCLIVKGDVTVEGTSTINNLNVTGIAHFFNEVQGLALSYGYLGFANQGSQNLIVGAPIQFDLISSNQGFFLGSADITPHTSLSNPLLVDGITLAQGTYYFYWQVKGRLVAPEGNQMSAITFELFSLTDNAAVAHSKFGSDKLFEAVSNLDYIRVSGAGMVTFTDANTIQLRNASVGTVTIPGLPVGVEPNEIIAEIIFLRVQT